jgi:hypothetical protein
LFWNGAEWRNEDSGTANPLLGVAGSGAGDVWAVGHKVVLHRDEDGTWKAVAAGGPDEWYSVRAFLPGELWAVGTSGAVLRRFE